MAISPEDKLKDAAKNFLIAAWIFDKLKIESSSLRPGEATLDLSEQNLLMCSYLMRSQAQFCAYERVKKTAPKKYALLAKLSMQACVFYGKAYSLVSTPPVCTAADPKNFVAVLQFSEHFYMASSYYWMAMQYKLETEETTVGIGKAIANIRKAISYLDVLRSLEKSLSPAILTQYRETIKHYTDQRTYLEDQNNKIYHESVPSKVDEIECMPFGQPTSIESELTKPFEGQETFARLVPPGVRALEDEYKTEVGNLMNDTFSISKQCDTVQDQFMAKHNLPSCLHAVSGEQEIPEDLWIRIKQCKEKGGVAGIQQIFSGVGTVANNNASTLQKLADQLRAEEEEDQALRSKYGSAWNRLPSPNLNMTLKKQIEHWGAKFAQGKKADEKIQALLDSNKEHFALIELEKAAITARIPKPQHGVESLSPAAAKLTEELKVLGELKKECEGTVESMIKTFEGDNVTNEMTQVYQKLKDKKQVFEELKGKYAKMRADLVEKTKKRQDMFPAIDEAMGEFSKEKASSAGISQRAEVTRNSNILLVL